MENNDLIKFAKKCRCCLHDVENQEKLCIGEIVREKFFEMTQFEMSDSTKLSQSICYSCFSILSRYSALKKGFIDNQLILNNILSRAENLKVHDFYVKVEAIHEHKGTDSNENQGVIALKNLEDFYHVEEFDDKNVGNLEVDTNASDRSIFCSICNKNFINNRTLKDHTDRVHLKIKKHHCKHCSYSCFSGYELYRHRINNHKDKFTPSKKFLCDLCALEFTQSSCLLLHKKTYHFKITRYECDKCGHKTYKKENLAKHMNVHVPNSLKILFKCKKCPATLTSLHILKLHEKNIHSQHKKDFQCPHPNCDKSFSREISLKDHQKFVHLKFRPLNCDKCEMSFSSKSHLNRHQKRKHSN